MNKTNLNRFSQVLIGVFAFIACNKLENKHMILRQYDNQNIEALVIKDLTLFEILSDFDTIKQKVDLKNVNDPVTTFIRDWFPDKILVSINSLEINRKLSGRIHLKDPSVKNDVPFDILEWVFENEDLSKTFYELMIGLRCVNYGNTRDDNISIFPILYRNRIFFLVYSSFGNSDKNVKIGLIGAFKLKFESALYENTDLKINGVDFREKVIETMKKF